MTTIEKRNCRCGNEMEVKSTRHGASYYCPNCDRNPNDGNKATIRAYNKTIDLLSRGWYPRLVNGTKKPEGWPNEAGSERHNAPEKKKEDGK